MKFPFLNKSISSNSIPSWPSCQQSPRTTSFRATIVTINTSDDNEEDQKEEEAEIMPLPPTIIPSSSSSSASTIDVIEEIPETESIENVIKGIKSSDRLIFERKGKSNSILEEMNSRNYKEASCTCPWNPVTFSIITSDSWWKWLRYTRYITSRQSSKCTMKRK